MDDFIQNLREKGVEIDNSKSGVLLTETMYLSPHLVERAVSQCLEAEKRTTFLGALFWEIRERLPKVLGKVLGVESGVVATKIRVRINSS